ncbi:GNAT family N-acetyltransferase [Lysobacter korlensis]|uniref:GNAT family N-acetyltransferase n=1 Tax=Lysobacter korlensis TaxID=553636 RepID=A0ABV6RPD2_9GAMM
MHPRIREAVDADIAPMHVIRLAVRENTLSDPSWLTPEVYRTYLATGSKGCTWVAELDGRIVGFSTARLGERDIWALFVDPACEGCGIGRALLDAAIAWLFARGAEAIELGTTPDTRADRFYRAAGWQRGAMTERGDVIFRLPNPSVGASLSLETASC